MDHKLQFDFQVDKEKKAFFIKREFNAGRDQVWRAWTDPELLNQWWAPRPYRTVTKSHELREGGTWLYSMVSPEDEKHWCKAVYQKIEPVGLLSWLDAFCDENGIENAMKPPSHWTSLFSEKNGITTVDITLQQDSLEAVEMMVSMGFKEGFSMAMGNLDELLAPNRNS